MLPALCTPISAVARPPPCTLCVHRNRAPYTRGRRPIDPCACSPSYSAPRGPPPPLQARRAQTAPCALLATNPWQGAFAFNQGPLSWDTSRVRNMKNMFSVPPPSPPSPPSPPPSPPLPPSPSPPPPPPSPPSPPSPQGCESSNTFADHASLKTAVAEYDYRPHVAREKYGAIAGWCVWGVTDMNGLFMNMHRFNQDISDWDTSRVTAMDNMFNVRFPPRSTSQTALAAVALPPTRPAARPAPSVCPVLATLGRTRASSTGPCAGTPPASRPWTTCFT